MLMRALCKPVLLHLNSCMAYVTQWDLVNIGPVYQICLQFMRVK